MNGKGFGAVCDVSVLVDRASFERAQRLLDGGQPYLPSVTYSWLARDKLIAVRSRAIGYSLVSQFVRDGELLVVYLPELYDELARRLLFEVEREVSLTDLRALMLAAHLRLPLLTLDGEIADRLREHVGARTILRFGCHADQSALREALDFYPRLAADAGNYLSQRLGEEGALDDLVERLEQRINSPRMTVAIPRLGQPRVNPGELELEYMAWNLMPVLCEYFKQHVLPPEVIRKLCERALLLVASPSGWDLEKEQGYRYNGGPLIRITN